MIRAKQGSAGDDKSVMNKVRWIRTYLSIWRILPAFVAFRCNRFRKECEEDLSVWIKYFPAVEQRNKILQLGYLLVNQKEVRNIFHNRLHRNPLLFVMVRMLFPPMESLYINMPPEDIGGGFSVQHGFSTIIAAKKIGKNCRIFQQVTVGYNGDDQPVIGDQVEIMAGAIVIGDVKIGDRAKIAAGAVVVRDVATDAVVAGVPARMIHTEKIIEVGDKR